MKIQHIFLLSILIVSTANAELLDPRTRDEDISGTNVSVEVSQDALGLYHYVYTLMSPDTNLGTIGSFKIYIGCNDHVGSQFDLSTLGLNTDSISKNGFYVPVASSGDGYTLGVTMDNWVLWGHNLMPGHTSHDTIISSYGPTVRMFTIEPRMSPVGYDYASYEYAAGLFPWIPDFTVTSYTKGPACPGDEHPLEMPRFSGTIFPNESETINKLLTYSAPTRDRFHVDSSTNTIDITIYYDDNVDPSTFVVRPQKHNIRSLFHPIPGSHEKVTIPLDQGKNKILIKVKAKFINPTDMNDAEYNGRGPETDQDDFEIYVEDSRHANNGTNK